MQAMSMTQVSASLTSAKLAGRQGNQGVSNDGVSLWEAAALSKLQSQQNMQQHRQQHELK